MPKLHFQVEFVAPDGKYLLARQLDEGTFSFSPGATLKGLPLKAMANPPAQQSDGTPRVDLFVVALRNPSDTARFKVGDVVPLLADDLPSPRLA
jgi:hypothetical protein